MAKTMMIHNLRRNRNMIPIPLNASKETGNKLRWSTWVEDDKAPFELYIPKWRVPEHWPGRIFVGIDQFAGDPSDFTQSPWDSDNLDNPIEVLVKPIKGHTRTFKYAPVGDKESWQTGCPYIPYSLIPPHSRFLIIEVKWDLDSKGQFGNVPNYCFFELRGHRAYFQPA